MAQAFERLRHRPSGGRSKAWAWPRLLISVVAGARNHLQANRSLGFCFEILISNLCWERRRTAGSRPHPVPLSVVNTRPLRPRLPPSASPFPRRSHSQKLAPPRADATGRPALLNEALRN